MRRGKGDLWKVCLVLLLLMLVATGCGGNDQPTQGTAPGEGKDNAQTESQGTSSSGDSQGGDVVKIGVIVAETGPASGLGKPEADTVKMLKKQIGEINGKKIELILKDYETNDTTAVVAMKKLISEDKVVAVVGATQTSASMAIRQVAQENKVPMLALAPMTELGDYVYQIPASNIERFKLITDYLLKQGIKTVAWTNSRDGFGQTGLDEFKQVAAEKGIEVVAVEDFDASATDMTVQLTKIKGKNPGAIIVWSRTPGSAIVAKNYKQLGMTMPMIQSDASANQGFLDLVGEQGDGVLVIGSKLNVTDQLPDSDHKKLLQKFAEDFKKEAGYEANHFSGLAYDGIQIVLKAIEAGHVTPEAINNYLENEMGVYAGLTATFQFSKEKHDGADMSGLVIMKVENGGWKLVE